MPLWKTKAAAAAVNMLLWIVHTNQPADFNWTKSNWFFIYIFRFSHLFHLLSFLFGPSFSRLCSPLFVGRHNVSDILICACTNNSKQLARKCDHFGRNQCGILFPIHKSDMCTNGIDSTHCACTLFACSTRAHDFRVERIHFIVLVHWIRTGAYYMLFTWACVCCMINAQKSNRTITLWKGSVENNITL